MKPWKTLAQCATPDGTPMELRQRDTEFLIRVAGQDLMSSRMHESEDALGRLIVNEGHAPKRVLIGGMGLGFTLRAALDASTTTKITIAELVPEVIEWNRGPLAHLHGDALKDRRVETFIGPVQEAMKEPKHWDAILLDVDNGPVALTQRNNDSLYSIDGLKQIAKSLRPGGFVAVWSAGADERFERRLKQAGFRAKQTRFRARPRAGATHTIWIGQRPKR